MIRILSILIIGAAALCLSLPNSANAMSHEDEKKRKPAPAFQKIDQDGDQGITNTEMKQYYGSKNDAMFKKLDDNDDGKITFREWYDMTIMEFADGTVRAGEGFDEIDGDEDGAITKDEFTKGNAVLADRFFDLYDMDNDAKVTPPEFAIYQNDIRQAMGEEVFILIMD
jgi:Ca2+-binding EF-hand superfamily protein